VGWGARRVEGSGGGVGSSGGAAAERGAAGGRAVSMGDLIRATEREYQKLGRLTVEAEFGEYLALTRSAG
jgi:hypothetical protein